MLVDFGQFVAQIRNARSRVCLGVEFPLAVQQVRPDRVHLEDADGQSFDADGLCLHVQDTDVTWNLQQLAGVYLQRGGLAESVAAHKSVPVANGQKQLCVRQLYIGSERHVKVLDPDVRRAVLPFASIMLFFLLMICEAAGNWITDADFMETAVQFWTEFRFGNQFFERLTGRFAFSGSSVAKHEKLVSSTMTASCCETLTIRLELGAW